MPEAPSPRRQCPRCAQDLEPVDLKGFPVESCAKCHGTLLKEGQLAPVLEAMSTAMMAAFNPDAKLEAIADRGGGVACPACGKPMSNDDYCAAHLVFFDRCEACGAMWLDPDELGTMSLMWARMNARHTRDATDAVRELAHADGFVDGFRLRGVVSRALFGSDSLYW